MGGRGIVGDNLNPPSVGALACDLVGNFLAGNSADDPVGTLSVGDPVGISGDGTVGDDSVGDDSFDGSVWSSVSGPTFLCALELRGLEEGATTTSPFWHNMTKAETIIVHTTIAVHTTWTITVL